MPLVGKSAGWKAETLLSFHPHAHEAWYAPFVVWLGLKESFLITLQLGHCRVSGSPNGRRFLWHQKYSAPNVGEYKTMDVCAPSPSSSFNSSGRIRTIEKHSINSLTVSLARKGAARCGKKFCWLNPRMLLKYPLSIIFSTVQDPKIVRSLQLCKLLYFLSG